MDHANLREAYETLICQVSLHSIMTHFPEVFCSLVNYVPLFCTPFSNSVFGKIEGISFSMATAQKGPEKEGLRVHCQMYLSQKQV